MGSNYGRCMEGSVGSQKPCLGSFCLNPGNKSPTMVGKYTTKTSRAKEGAGGQPWEKQTGRVCFLVV